MENDNYDEEDSDNYYDWLDKLNERSFCTAVVRKTDNCFLGYVAIKDISHELWEISIEFLNKFCRCGYGTQSLKMFIDKVSEITGRIEYKALVEVDNSRDNLPFAENQMRKKGKESFKDELREVIQVEIADKTNKTFDDVIAALWRHYNVETRVKGNTVSYRHPEYKDKNGNLVSVRGSKLGDLYTQKGIEYELTKKLARQYDKSAEAESSGEITDSAEARRFPYGNIGKSVAENTDLERGQLKRNRGQISVDGVSDNGRRNVQNSGDFYERYRKRHKKSKGRTNKAVKPPKRVHQGKWERD